MMHKALKNALNVDVPVHATFEGNVTGTISLVIEGVLHIEVEPPEPPEPPEPEEPFIVDETTVGAGIIRPYPTNVVSGPVTYTTPGGRIVDTIFENYVAINAPGVVAENCVFRGPVTRTDGKSNLVDTTKGVATEDLPVPELRYCDVRPQVPSSYWNGVGYKNYTLTRCHVWECTDNLAAFALKSDPDPAVHVTVKETLLEKLSQFKPDVAGNRDVTHNDLCQCQGNVGPADDILFDNVVFKAYASQEVSNPLPPQHTQISALMLSPSSSCQDQINITVRNSNLSGGVFTFNGSAGTLGKSTIVLEDNVWELPHQSTGGPSAAIALDATLTQRTLSGNVYTDGTEVRVYAA